MASMFNSFTALAFVEGLRVEGSDAVADLGGGEFDGAAAAESFSNFPGPMDSLATYLVSCFDLTW